MDVALNACHHHQTECGTKIKTLDDSTEEITTKLVSDKQSCHYILKSVCKAPFLELKGSQKLRLSYYEYTSDDKVDSDILDKATDLPHAGSYMYSQDTLGTLKMKKTGEKDSFCNASGAKVQKEMFMDEKADYDAKLKTYEADVKAYNSAVAKVETELKDEERVIGEKRGPRGQRETSLTKLPLKPTPPMKPATYSGIDVLSADVSYYAGFGIPTSGDLSLNTFKYGSYKTFGMLGQGFNNDSTSYVNTLDGEDVSTCKTRYIALNIVPLGGFANTDQVTIKASKQSKFMTLDISAADKKLDSITAAKASPFLQQDAAMNLIAATTASMALVAATLF